MIDLDIHGIKDDTYRITLSDLVVMSNIENENIDTTLMSRLGNTYTIKGVHPMKIGSYAIVGCEIVKILTQEKSGNNTIITAEREQLGTIAEAQVETMKFRTVVPMINPIQLLSWEFNDSMGSIGNNVFPVELSSGKLEIKDDPKKWMQFSLDRIYKIKVKKSMAFMFKGANGKCFLKNVAVVERVGFNTQSKTNPNKITISLKSILFKWYDKDMAINQHIKAEEPKEFLKLLFGLEDKEVYYAQGVTADSFVKIGNIHTKEYKKMSDILRAYASCGVRFCFDRYEKIKIFSDMIVDNIKSQKTLQYNITDIMMNESSLLVFNTIDTESTQRQTLFDFDELNRQYVHFAKTLPKIIKSNTLIGMNKNAELEVNAIEIVNAELFNSVQLKDYVMFKQTIPPYIEVYGKVGGLLKGNTVVIFPILQGDKDYKLFYYGKGEYLYDQLNVQVCDMDIHFARFDLPMIWRYTRNTDSSEKYSTLMYPVLPKVDGVTKYENEISMSFGSASNLEIGEYAGIIEEVQPIYGTWDNTKLLYNQEKTQFSGTTYPPIFALSNRAKEKTVSQQPLLYYTHFDNSGLLLEITKNDKSSSSGDGKLKISSTLNANSLIDIYTGEEVSRIGNRVLEVADMTPFKIGDILIVKNFENPTVQEEKLFDEKLSKIRWRITNKVSEVQSDKSVKHYIFLDSNFPPASNGKKYQFERFPVDKIVYLQELYFRGNPVIQFSQEVSGFSKETNSDGDLSKDIYGEKPYSFDAKLLEKDGVKMLMGYILDNFNGVTPLTTKYTLPVSLYNGIDIELYDVVSVIDTVFTHIGTNLKWLVTSVKYSSKTNTVDLTLLNLNNKNTKPYDINIDDVMDYKPVEIPKYDHAGGEGETDKPNDGSGGTDQDKALGQVALAEVDKKIFRARIDRVEGNYIYFKDFGGTEWEKYVAKLFPESEFAINVDGEIVFVESDREYRAYIKKRKMYDTEEAVIMPELEVGFYVVSTMVDIDGTFYSRRVHIGDGDTYFKFHPINGAHFKGDFVIGENGQHAGNDLWESLQKNRTYHQSVPPVSDALYTLRTGDIWYDLDDENHVYRYNGDVWISCRDNSIISSKSSTFVQPDEPKPTAGRPINDGDTWYDSDDGNKPYVYKNGKWVNVTDMSLETAINEAKAQAEKANNKLSEIASDDRLTESEKQSTTKDWDIIKGEYPKIIEEAKKFSVNTTGYTTAYTNLNSYLAPLLADLNTTSIISGSMFRLNFQHYYDNRQIVLNGISSKAKELADNAQQDATTALGNAKIFYQTTPPTTGMKTNDLWYDTDDGNHPYVYNGATWISARDKIFETEGGNKVYFQSTQPPTTGVGVKDGDMWFHTGANNKMYVLINKTWTLADDALDKVNTGRIVLNGNTTVNGDFRVTGSNVVLTASTTINGTLSVYGGDKGIISYNGSTESNSTKRIVIQGGQILFQERV